MSRIIYTVWGKLRVAEVDLKNGFTAKDLLKREVEVIQDDVIVDTPFAELDTEFQVFDISSDEVCWITLKEDYPEILAEILEEVPEKAKKEWEDDWGDYYQWLEWFKKEYGEFIKKHLEK